jgi:hypothetical protein
MILLFENYDSNPKSKAPMELYNELKPLFDPVYMIDRPSGYKYENINISFNKNTSFSDVKDIIKNANWYVEKFITDTMGNARRINIRPYYSEFVVRNYPKKVYHASPSVNDRSMELLGIKAKSNKKMVKYPNRIYLSKGISQKFKKVIKELNWFVGKKQWSIWEIDLSKMDIDYLYVDDTVSQILTDPTFYYLQEIDVSPKYINKIGTYHIT